MEVPSLWDARPRHERTRSCQSRPASHSQAEPDQPYYGQSGQSPQLSTAGGVERPSCCGETVGTVADSPSSHGYHCIHPSPFTIAGAVAVAVAIRK